MYQVILVFVIRAGPINGQVFGASAALYPFRPSPFIGHVVLEAGEEESSKLVPNHTFDKAPNYLVKGGFIFQELTLPILQAFGEDWNSRAPLNLLDVHENPEKYQDRADRVHENVGCFALAPSEEVGQFGGQVRRAAGDDGPAEGGQFGGELFG